MKPDNTPQGFGGTAIYKALKAAKKELEKQDEGDRMILLVTDGQSYDLVGNEAQIISELKEARITVFCVLASDENPQDEVITICNATGGASFTAGDPDALNTVFKKIDTMKQAKLTPTLPETIAYYEPLAIIGLGLLVLYVLASFVLRYSPW
jgi:Ca-activated chloride channel family protein